MVIRSEQMLVLEQACNKAFEERMLARLRQYFPKHAELLSEDQLRGLIGLALDRARGHNLVSERNVALYLDLMCLLGSGFDTDAQIPWAARILADRSCPTPDARAGQLHAQGWDFAQKSLEDFKDPAGKKAPHRLVAVLDEIGRRALDSMPPQALRGLADQLCADLQAAFPVRCAIIGKDCLARVARRAVESSREYGIDNARGISLFAIVSLVAGADFDRDPQLPWASRILSDESTSADSIARTQRFHTEALECFRQWWDLNVGTAAQ
jgi:hypothetical protein